MNLELPNVRSNRPSVTQSPPKGLHDIPAPASNQFTPAKNGDDLVLGTPTYSPRATPDKAADDDKAKDINKEGEEEETEEVKGHQNDGESNSSGGVLISILINILFIASFLMEFRISDANKMNFAIHQEFDQYPISTNPQMFLSDLSKIEDVVFFIESVLYDSVLNPNRTYTPLKYPTTLSESVDLDWYKSTSTDTAAESNDDLSTKVYSNVSTYYFLNSFNLFKGMMITAEYNENYIYTEETPTQAFLSATISQQDAKNTLDKIVYYLVNGYIVSLQMDTIFFNVITQIGLYYDIHFSQQDQANFQVSKSVKPFFPKTFDSDSVDKTIQVLIILFRALFALALIFRIIKVIIIDLYKALKTFFQTQKLELPASLVFNIGVLGLLLVVLILSVYNTINQLNSFETYDVISQSKFKHYLSYANFLSAFMRLLAITICVLVIQILLLLNTQFPTFGVLFHTLGNSKNKLLIYGALVITLMAGFIVFLTLNFGPYDSDMSDFGSSLLLVFEFMIGVVDLDKLNEANEYLGWIYFFVFYLIFNLLVLLLFIVIIISTYVQLRKKLQLTTLALAELAAEKSNKLKEKYIRLLLFKPPPEEVDDEQGPKKGRKRRVQSKKKKNLLEILLFNLEEVDWFGFTNNNRQTRDEIEEEIKNKITEIKFRRMQQKKKKMQDRRSELFEKIYNLAFYIIFIVIYTYTVTFELKVEAAFELNQTIENYYVNTVFQSESGLNKTFYDISTIEDIARWTKEAYLGRIYTGFATESQTATSIIQPYDQNAIFSSSISRINFRNLKTITQTDSSNQNTFTVRVSKDISPSSSYSRNEIITDLTSVDGVLDKPYTFSGTYETYRKHGGYVWVFTRDIDTARTQMAEIQHPQVLNINTGLITMETVYVNRNYQILGLSEFMFEIDSTGDVKNTYKTRTFQVDLYSCDNCTAKLVFEILYLLCVLKQTFDFVKHWFGEWKGTSELTPVNEELKNSPWHVRLINYDLENIKLFGLIFAIGLRIWQILHRMFVTSTNLFKKSYAYLILVMSLILTYVSFYFYGSILSNNLRDSYNVNQAFATLDGQDLALEVGRYEEMSMLFENYSIVQAFNAWLIILRVLFQYGFSRELSLVLELIYEALFDIIFFTAMFVIILLGFSINGYLLFGTEAQSFSDISQSLLQVLLMMISGDNPDDLLAVDKITRAIYFIILVVVCLLILLKMFIAILDGHFTDLTSDSTNNDDLGVFELIVSIVVEKVKAAKIEESYQEIPENTGTLNKWRIKATNALKKLRLKLLRALRRIIFGEEDEIVVTKQEEEGEELEGEKKEKKKKNIEMDLKFNEVEEERRADLQDIEIYLNENEKKKPHDILSSEQNEDDLTVPSKWMNFLEESVTRITNGKINFSKFGTGARDYLNMEVKADQDMSLRFNEIEKKCNEDRPKTIPLVDFYVEYVAIPDYNTNLIKKSIGQVFYERVVDHINFIYHKSIEQASTEKIVESPVDADEGSDSFPEISALKLSRSRTTLKLNTLAPNRGAYRETKFSDPHENLLKFWDKLKFKHQYALWGGDKASLLTNDIRHCLWKMMKFEGASFGHFIPKDIFEQRGLNQEKIGMKELECIWNNLAENDDNATKDNFGEKESYQAFNPKHIDLIEYIIRANFENIVFELRKFETIKEKINFLKSVKNVKNDPKLMIWLLTSPNIKIEMLLRIQNNVLAEFSMLLLMEEIYDNTYLVQKIEKELDHEMRNRIYMHFFFFANYEASQHSLIQRKEDYLPEQDPDLLEYIGFLEAQLRSTNTAKKRYLDEINRIIKAEEQAKGQDPLLAQSIEKLAIASQAADEEKDMLMRVSQSEVDSNTESVTKSIAKEEGEENVKEQEEPGKKELKVETNFNAKIEIANARAKRLENLKKVNQ